MKSSKTTIEILQSLMNTMVTESEKITIQNEINRLKRLDVVLDAIRKQRNENGD